MDELLVNNKSVYFIRHNTQEIKEVETLKENNRLGLFYQNKKWSEVFDPTTNQIKRNLEGNRAYRPALNSILEISQSGAYAFVEYNYGELTGDRYGCILVEIPKQEIERCGDLQVTLGYRKIREIAYLDFPVLLAIRAQGTIFSPKRKTWAEVCRCIIENKQAETRLHFMHPNMAEQMCVEYLRQVGINNGQNDGLLKYCSLKVGKTLASVDIVGRANNSQQIVCQVKNGNITKGDLNNFKKACKGIKNAISIVFAQNQDLRDSETFRFINIEDVFNYFLEIDEEMLKDMIGIKVGDTEDSENTFAA